MIEHLLSLLTLVPLVGAFIVAGLPSTRASLARSLGLLVTGIAGILAMVLWANFDSSVGEFQFVERHDWIPSIQVQYLLGVDGLSLLMVLLTALVVPFGLLASWRVEENTKAFVALMLLFQAGLFGTFTALNFIHWFLFYEISLVPAYFLIKLWGGPQRVSSANQFFVYTMLGSVMLLLSMLAVFLVTGSFDLRELADKGRTGEIASLLNIHVAGWYGISPRTLALVIFFGAFLGFAVKVPVWPFHTWLPATYAEAPVGVSMILTGVMSKLGVYGFLRILLPIFPDQMRWMLTPLLWLAVVTIVFSACAAFAQRDLKRIIAYSSINHLGYCLLGIFAVAEFTESNLQRTTEKAAVLNGVMLQMFSHGITAAALFYFVGLIEQRTGRRGLEDFGGLRKVAPVFCGLMGITLFASIGMPGLSGFIGEFLIFKGVFSLAGWAAAFSSLGLLVTAIFLLAVLQRVWSGPLSDSKALFPDLTVRERFIVFPSIILMFVLGLWPQLLLKFTNPTVLQILEGLRL